MTISIKFLDKMYARKHESEGMMYSYTQNLKKSELAVKEAKTDRAKKQAEKDVVAWTNCITTSDRLLCCIVSSIRDYVVTHDGSKELTS